MSQFDLTAPLAGTIDYWQLFRDLPEAYMVFEATPDYRIVDINRAREQLMSVGRKQAIGRPLFEVFPDMGPRLKPSGEDEVRRHIERVVRSRKPQRIETLRYDTPDNNGLVLPRYWESVLMPVFGPDKRVQHILSMARDVTDSVRAARRAASVEDRLEAALAVGKVGSWLWDVGADTITADRNLAKLFHLDQQQLLLGLTLADFLQAVHPEDRSRVERAIRGSIAGRSAFEEEYRITMADSTLRWVLARGKVEDQDGKLLFPGVIVDITERRDLQAQIELARRQDRLNRRAAKILQRRNEELEAIGHSKDEFVALASHQLRTPATAVKQYLGMVLQGYAGDISEIQADMLQKAFESNERQIQIINQILNAARADTGRLLMTPIPLDLRTLVRSAWTDMRSVFEQRHQHYGIRLPRSAVVVRADQGYLRMAVENLLHNASVYTPDGGSVSIRLTRSDGQAVLSVIDTGVGIKKADFHKLFAKFSRIHNSLSVQAGGSGIGLYLAGEIVRLHGGSISVESKIRQGSTFAILLPLVHNDAR